MHEKELSDLLPHVKDALGDLHISGGQEADASKLLHPTEVTVETQAAERAAKRKKQLEQENALQLIKQNTSEPA